MRNLLLLPLVLLAVPAAARERAPAPLPQMRADQLAAALSDPLVQETVAAVVGQVAGAVLDTHVGPIARYAPRAGIGPDTTLGDLARRNDPAFDRHLHDNTVGAVALAGRGAQDAIAMSAELRVTAARLRRALDAAAGVLDQPRQP